MSENENPQDEQSQSHEELEAPQGVEELSDEDLEDVAGGWNGAGDGGG